MPETPPAASRGSLAAVFAVVFIDLLGFGIVLPVLGPYGKYYHASGLMLGALLASFSAMQFLVAPSWGRLSDRIGRRPVLLIGLVGSVVFYGLFGVATGMGPEQTLLGLPPLAWLFISRIGAGVAGATISTAQAYIADVTGPTERAKGMALIGAAFGMGFTFGPLLGLPFASDDPHAPPSPGLGYLAAGLSAGALLLAVAVLKEPARHAGSAVKRTGRWDLARDPLRLAVLGEVFLATAAFAIFESSLALLGKRYGNSDLDNYILFAFIGVTLTIAQGLLVRRLAPRLRERRMAPLGLTLMAVGLAALTAVELAGGGIDAAFYAALMACVVGFAFLNPALQSLLSLSTPDGQQGAVLGLGQSASALARIVGPLVGLWLFDLSVPTTYAVSAGLMVLGLLAIVPVLRLVDHDSSQTANEVEPIPTASTSVE